MKRKYYITSFIHGVVFTSIKQLRAYYIRSTKKINAKTTMYVENLYRLNTNVVR